MFEQLGPGLLLRYFKDVFKLPVYTVITGNDFSTELTQNSNINNDVAPAKTVIPAEWDIWKIKSVSCEAGDLLHLHDPLPPLECVQEQLAAENQGCMTAGQKC